MSHVFLVRKCRWKGTALVGLLALTASSCSSNHAEPAKVVPAGPPPSAILVGPTTGAGLAETFTARFEDPRGAVSLIGAGIIINDTLSAQHACYIYYDGNLRQITLMDDTKAQWLQGIAPGGAGKVENSQCSVDASRSTVTTESVTLTLKAVVTFKPAFAGKKKIYLYGADQAGATTGYAVGGDWLVAKDE